MKSSAELEDRKFTGPTPSRITAMEADVDTGSNPALPPHPASWRALKLQLAQETAARELAEALHEKKARQLEEALARIARLEELCAALGP